MDSVLIDYLQNQVIDGPAGFQLTKEDNLLESGLVDSIGIMKLIGFIEEQFGMVIPPEDMIIENFISVQAIQTYLQSKA